MTDSYGLAVERGLRELSGRVGVADFVFRPVDQRKGRAQREIGDFILWVGDIAAVVSVKSRAPDAGGTEERIRSWLDKNIAAASKQLAGVVRALRSTSAGALELESERNVRVPWDPHAVRGFVGVVVVDVALGDIEFAPPVINNPVPTVPMLADDWAFVHSVLPSTSAVIKYVARRQHLVPACPLGAEPDVLALIIEQEQTGRPIEIPRDGLQRDHFERTAAAHPDWFLGGHPDDRYAFVIDAMIEGAADADPTLSETVSPEQYIRITEFLDRIPLLQRVSIGENVLERCTRAGRTGAPVVGLFAIPHGLMVFAADDADRSSRSRSIRSLAAARHSQALDAGAPPSLMTLGVATEPYPTNGRSHDFVLIRGAIRSDPDFATQRDELFGATDVSPMVRYWRENGLV